LNCIACELTATGCIKRSLLLHVSTASKRPRASSALRGTRSANGCAAPFLENLLLWSKGLEPPKSCPHKTSAGLEGQVIKLRKQTGFGAERLVQEFDLKISHNAVARIIRAHGLTRPRKKKPATKKQLRSVKREWKLFGQITADTKYLQDIPNYWPQMMRHRLPRFQYTAREVVSGACFAGYADELSKSYAVFLAEQLSAHLALHGVDLSQVVWQTDNGGEFQENKEERGLPSTVRSVGSDHRFMKMSSWIARHSKTRPSFLPKPPLTGATSTSSVKTAERSGKAL
jgi:hypothetical protein